jgi:two-component system cell cycle response regulator
MNGSQDHGFLLVIWSSDRELVGHRHPLESSTAAITVGRRPTNTLVFASGGVSRSHAHFEKRDDGWWVFDDGSSHGTFVNEERVEGVRLRMGDRIRFGDTMLLFTDTAPIVNPGFNASPTDGLTKLHNRRHLIERIDRELQHPGQRLALVLFDIDHFKRINDTHGHLAGDEVLRGIASLMQQHARPDDTLARYGGEEFVLLLPGVARQEATSRAEAICAAIATHEFAVEGHAISVTLSVGIAQANEGTHSADELIRSADLELYAARVAVRETIRASRPKPLAIDSTLGLCASRDSRTIDVGAGNGGGVLVVADGMGGHCTGWLGARLAARVLVEQLASEETRFVGAAESIPDDWGWAGAMQSRRAGERVYEECLVAFGDRSALPRDLGGLFSEIDRVVATVPPRARIQGLMVGCIAATIDGVRVHGAHVGIGRALLLRAGADRFESLVVEHYWHLVPERMAMAPDVDRAQIPPNIIVNGLGILADAKVGIDAFDVELHPGDLLLVCSRCLDLPEDEVARIARTALNEGAPLDELARTLERRSAAVFEASEAHRASDVAFAIALARATAT